MEREGYGLFLLLCDRNKYDVTDVNADIYILTICFSWQIINKILPFWPSWPWAAAHAPLTTILDIMAMWCSRTCHRNHNFNDAAARVNVQVKFLYCSKEKCKLMRVLL